MTFLPIVERELRVASRRPSTHWVRLAAALVALLVGAWIMLLPAFNSAQQLGITLFVALSIVSYTYCLLAGVRTTADSLSEEKREGTLGLLFLTDLKGYDIILGKLTATSLNLLYGILAIFPVMAIPLLLGGVSIEEFWRVVVVCLNNLFFSLTAGMFVSSIARDERRAAALCFFLLTLFSALLPLLGVLIAEYRHAPQPHAVFLIPSPGYGCVMAFDAMFSGMSRNYYYPSIICVHLLGWAFLVLSCLIVPSTWQDKAQSAPSERRRSWWRQLAHGSAQYRLAIRRHMLGINAFYWLTGRDFLKPASVWLLLGAVGAIWSWGLIKYPNDWTDAVAYIWTALIVHTLLKLWIASEACRRVAQDRRSGALELLLATPISIREIIHGQFLSLRRQFFWPLLVVLCFDVVFLLTDRDKDWLMLWAAGILMLIADIITLPWVALWTGVSQRQVNRAAGAAVVRIMVLPWLIFVGLWTLIGLAMFRTNFNSSGWFDALPYVSWIVIGLGIDFIFGFWARGRLYAEFRDKATQRVDTRQLKAMQKALVVAPK